MSEMFIFPMANETGTDAVMSVDRTNEYLVVRFRVDTNLYCMSKSP